MKEKTRQVVNPPEIIPEGFQTEKVDVQFAFSTVRYLREDQVLCDVCKGTGSIVHEEEFGVEGCVGVDGNPWPFKEKFVRYCPHCTDGVRYKCQHCEKTYASAFQRDTCVCKGAVQEYREKIERCALERWRKAKRSISLADAMERFDRVYVENWDLFVDPKYIPALLEEKRKEMPDIRANELRVYGTSIPYIAFDAMSIIENALENIGMDDDVFDVLRDIPSQDIDELQTLLNIWADRISNAISRYYVVNYDVAVRVEGE